MGACARNMQSDPAEIKPAQCCIKLVFHLTYITSYYVLHKFTYLFRVITFNSSLRNEKKSFIVSAISLNLLGKIICFFSPYKRMGKIHKSLRLIQRNMHWNNNFLLSLTQFITRILYKIKKFAVRTNIAFPCTVSHFPIKSAVRQAYGVGLRGSLVASTGYPTDLTAIDSVVLMPRQSSV